MRQCAAIDRDSVRAGVLCGHRQFAWEFGLIHRVRFGGESFKMDGAETLGPRKLQLGNGDAGPTGKKGVREKEGGEERVTEPGAGEMETHPCRSLGFQKYR